MARSRWQEIVTEELRKDRNGAFARAKARYHGGHSMESNPSGGLVKWAVIGAAAYFGYKHFLAKPPAPAAIAAPAQGTTNGTARASTSTGI